MTLYDSRSDLVTRLTAIRAALDKVRTAQSYGSGQTTLQRANYNSLLKEEEMILKKIDSIDQASSGGAMNRVEFNNVI